MEKLQAGNTEQLEHQKISRDHELNTVYIKKALDQIPRLLSLQDRNPLSPTYGCFDRNYWLYKTSDFPDAVRQFGVQALALVYKYEMPNNRYYNNQKIKAWAIAGLKFWADIQHNDGSFDEFYPNERGWVGPTAFTTFSSIEAFKLLKDDMNDVDISVLRNAFSKAANFIAKGESEEDHLANHHAMACLAVWKAYEILDDQKLRAGYEKLWEGFLSYHNSEEGWSREYDGVDPGYLSATVSFLAKIYQTNHNPEILTIARQSIEFCSYFVYPNGFYAGSLGSRNTLHFYPHGFEVFGKEVPLSLAIAEKMLSALANNKLVPPEIMSDRYIFYRVPEFLQAYLDYTSGSFELPRVPYQKEPFTRYFQKARVYVANSQQTYIVANLAKGGVIKVFDRNKGHLILNDCGVIGRLTDGRVVTSQSINPSYKCHVDEHGWEINGKLQVVVSQKLFTPFKQLLFRSTLITLGWIPRFSHFLKKLIRRNLMLNVKTVPIAFRRILHFEDSALHFLDELKIKGNFHFSSLTVGDEFFVRYVPQSRYFQMQELDIVGLVLNKQDLGLINAEKKIIIQRTIKNNLLCHQVVTTDTTNPMLKTQFHMSRLK